jgi:beta-phosphoglucomutase-like phosphatase (HAD superfamily)
MATPIATVIFDMDGVLVDTEPLYFAVGRRLFRSLGMHIPHEEHQTFVGIPALTQWRSLKQRFSLVQSAEELARIERAAQLDTLQQLPELPCIGGIRELLVAIRERGATCCIATSSSRAMAACILAKARIAACFLHVVTGEDVTNGKPAPDIFLLAAQRAGATPPQCLVIEDSFHGVKAANAAGMRSVGFRNPGSGRQDLSAADLVIDDFSPRSRAGLLALMKGT